MRYFAIVTSVFFMILVSAQNHDQNVLQVEKEPVSTIDKNLVQKYTLKLSTSGNDGTRSCGGSVVSCENNYYVMTAKHCLKVRSRGNFNNLKQSFDAYYSGHSFSVDLTKDALEVRESGDLVRVKLPSENSLIKAAINGNRVLKCYKGSLSNLGNSEVKALGRPQCLNDLPFSVSCKGSQCSLVNASYPVVKVAPQKCFNKSLIGMSGGPVVSSQNGDLYFLGVNSQHVWTSKTTQGPLAFAPLPGMIGTSWRKSKALVGASVKDLR